MRLEAAVAGFARVPLTTLKNLLFWEVCLGVVDAWTPLEHNYPGGRSM
jgi:hypothetical protein